jgi:O-antigen biosynthesis protein
MKLSIFTPSHNTKYLKELEETILQQSHEDWEWIILTNNNAEYECSFEW